MPAGPAGTMASMPPFLGRVLRSARPLARAVTYTRWLHLMLAWFFALASAMVYPGLTDMTPVRWLLVVLVPTVPVAALGLVPVVRRAEGLQAQLMLFPGQHARVRDGDAASGISAAPSASWRDRVRTSVWLVVRLELGCLTGLAMLPLLGQFMALLVRAMGGSVDDIDAPLAPPTRWWAAALLVPVPVLLLMAVVVTLGVALTAAARRLLGPSPAQRLAALEERTEQLLERNRIAHELHDSIGHALSVAVVQAGAARAAGDGAFTERALGAIEETGRAALEDLERVLVVLRESQRPASARPALGEAERLLKSARASGAVVDAEVSGPVDRLPGAVSRECYRMLQESLTNVLRHAGPVPVRVRVSVLPTRVDIDVVNPLPPAPIVPTGRGGTGLRGIRERAALLGGHAEIGPLGGEWRVRVELPLG